MRKRKYLSVMYVVLFFLSVFLFKSYASGTVGVSNQQQLKDAINTNKSINITSSFEISEGINIPSNYNGTIEGNNNTLTLSKVIDNMFVSDNANVNFNFKNITLDGDNKGRLMMIHGGTVSFEKSKLTRGTTQNYESKYEQIDNKKF